MGTDGRIGIIGAGIVGLALARHILRLRPDLRVTVLEKEPRVAAHQSGRNSGVVHAGLYYRPGSLKAALCRRGAGLLRDYCAEHGISYVERGKLLVARGPHESARLDGLAGRARANEVPGVRRLGPGEIREIEPHVRGHAALYSPTTAVTDFAAVARALAADIAEHGGEVRLGATVVGLRQDTDGVDVVSEDTRGEREKWRFEAVVGCAGLHGDRLVRLCGAPADPRIVPFRGQYLELLPERRHLVQGLVYPVPDPRAPFLGVHLTRHVHGEVFAGPNAVLAAAREGYRFRDVVPAELAATLTWPGFWKSAARNWRVGAAELAVSLSRSLFARRAARLVPAIRPEDLRPALSGVRAQALAADGRLLDDFAVHEHGRITLVRNAPSPAATSALAIAEHLAPRVVAL